MGKLKKSNHKRKLSLLAIVVVVLLVSIGAFIYSNKNDTKDYIVPHDNNESTSLKLINNEEDKLSETENASPEQETTTPTSQNKNTYPKPYEASICTKIPIEPETEYEVVDWLPYKETKTFAGKAGWRQACTADSNGIKPEDVVLEPLNTLTYIGSYIPGPTFTYEEALAQSNNACRQGNVSDSFYPECMKLFMNTFGYNY